MPCGLWVVLYGKLDHFIIRVEKWYKNSGFLEFATFDFDTLKEALEDQPINQVVLFQDGNQCIGMRNVKIQAFKDAESVRVRISHEEEYLSQLFITH